MSVNMIEFGDKTYYIDFNAIDKVVNIKTGNKENKDIEIETTTSYDPKGKELGSTKTVVERDSVKQIDGAKYDIIRLLLEIIVDSNEEMDSELGAERALESTPLSYKIAFNTLLNAGIIKEVN